MKWAAVVDIKAGLHQIIAWEKLRSLVDCLSTSQLDSFNKAGSKGSGRLSRLFSARKSPRTSVASPGVSVQTSSPSVGPLTVDDMLTYQGGVSSSHPLLLYFLRRLCPSMQHFCTPLALPRNHSMYHRRVGLSSKLLMLLYCIVSSCLKVLFVGLLGAKRPYFALSACLTQACVLILCHI